LRKVTEKAAPIMLLGQKTNVVRSGNGSFKDRLGIAHLTHEHETVDQSERTDEERSFSSGKSVVHASRSITPDQSIYHQLASYPLDRFVHPVVVCGNKADERQAQQAGVDLSAGSPE
jgi:hypothetical protein